MKIAFRRKQKSQSASKNIIKKTDNEVLQEAVQLIKKSKQSLREIAPRGEEAEVQRGRQQIETDEQGKISVKHRGARASNPLDLFGVPLRNNTIITAEFFNALKNAENEYRSSHPQEHKEYTKLMQHLSQTFRSEKHYDSGKHGWGDSDVNKISFPGGFDPKKKWKVVSGGFLIGAVGGHNKKGTEMDWTYGNANASLPIPKNLQKLFNKHRISSSGKSDAGHQHHINYYSPTIRNSDRRLDRAIARQYHVKKTGDFDPKDVEQRVAGTYAAAPGVRVASAGRPVAGRGQQQHYHGDGHDHGDHADPQPGAAPTPDPPTKAQLQTRPDTTAGRAQADLDFAIKAYNTAQNKTERENAWSAIQKWRKVITDSGRTPGEASLAPGGAAFPTPAGADAEAAATTEETPTDPATRVPKCVYDNSLSPGESQYKLDVCLAKKRAAAIAALEEIVSLTTDPSEKTDDKILEEAIQSIQKSKQLINEDWASRWLPRWFGGGSNETPDWIPNILGKGSLIAPGGGISLKDREQRISPEMMAVIQRNHPDLDLSTREGFEDAMRLGGMTGEQAKAETEEYFETGMAGVDTAAALAVLYAVAPAAAGTAGAEVGAGGLLAGSADEAALLARHGLARTTTGEIFSTATTATGRRASMQAIQKLGLQNVARANSRWVMNIGGKHVLPKIGQKAVPSWGKRVMSKIWSPAARKWYGRYTMFELAALEFTPQLYDKYLKYVDPYHYVFATAQSFHIAPWLIGESKPNWVENYFGDDPEYGSILGFGEWFEPYMPWYDKNYAQRKDLRESLLSATEEFKVAMEKCGEKTPCPGAEEANKKRLAVIEEMKAQGEQEYAGWVKIAENQGVPLADLDAERPPTGQKAPGAAPAPAAAEEPTSHGPENPAVYAYGTEAEKAHYEQLKQSSEKEGEKEFLNHYIYGGEEGEE